MFSKCGRVESDGTVIPDIKSVSYRVGEFLGQTWIPSEQRHVYQIVLYLAPGDYHGFHAPADLQLSDRKHFGGLLLPVAPWMLKLVPNLFEINERVVLNGLYKSTKSKKMLPMSYVAVGATNVGSVALKFDPSLKTNCSKVEISDMKYEKAIGIPRGLEVGFFRMGSTIVMVFEAEKDFKFIVQPGQTVRLGQRLGN